MSLCATERATGFTAHSELPAAAVLGRRASLLRRRPKAGRAAERQEGRVRRALRRGLADGPLPLPTALFAQSFSKLLGDAVPRMSVLLYLLHALGVEEKCGYPGGKRKLNFKENT